MSTAASLDSLLMRPGVFDQPIRLAWPPSWMTHIPFAFWIVDVLRPGTFVELGTHSGVSYAAFVQAIRARGLGTACYAVDTWQGDPQAGHYGEDVFAEWSRFHDEHFASGSRLVRSTFDEASAMFADGSIDLLHIDGLHTYEAVRHDFETWLPKLSPRGVVLMHDTNVRERDFGAWRFWDEVAGRHPTFSFLHGHGLGVAAIGADIPTELRWLVTTAAAQPETRTLVRDFFANLGGAVERRWQLSTLEATTTELRQQLADAAEQAGRQSAEREALTGQLTRARRRQRELRTELAALEADARRHTAPRGALQPGATAVPWPPAAAQAATGSGAAADPPLSDLEQARETIAALERQSAAAETELADLRVTAAQAVGAHRAARRALTAATVELQGLRANRLWRLTQAARGGPSGLGTLLAVRRPRAALSALRAALSRRQLAELRALARSGLFDARYYRERYPDVRRSGLPPLLHYVVAGAREGRAPHPLFDGTFYLRRYADVRDAGVNPLVHYASAGLAELRDPHPIFSAAHYAKGRPEVPLVVGRTPLDHYLADPRDETATPHPLFDTAFYLRQYPDAAASGLAPLVHFLEHGAAKGYSPHPLFDSAYYLRNHPDVGGAGTNPLVHYLERVPGEDRDPHPLFDSSYYLQMSPDVAATGTNPLVHFVEHGWREGRRPNPGFDPRWYLETNPDVAESGENPLAHYARAGWREGRDPSPEFNTAAYLAAYSDVATERAGPLVHFLHHGLREGRIVVRSHAVPSHLPPLPPVRLRAQGTARADAPIAGRTIVCLTHVVPWPPRAGNEYRILRLLEWLTTRGYRTLLVLAPLGDTAVTPAQLDELAARVGNVALCHRDGGITYALTSCPDVFATLDGRRTRNVAALLGERRRHTPHQLDLLRVERTFCHDAAIEVTLEALDRLPQVVLLAEYVWMARVLPLVDNRVPRIIDTIDMQSSKGDKVFSFGISDLAMSETEETERLRRADLIVAIQDRERHLMQALVPETEVITAGVDFPQPVVGAPEPGCVLLIASGNVLNRAGLEDFLRFAWPAVREQVPDARLLVAGRVGDSVRDAVPGVDVLGPVDDLAPLYTRARVVVNPTAAGTGLKIKTVEALNYERPIVAWPNGFDGIPASIRETLGSPGDWLEFAELVVGHLRRDGTPLDAATVAEIRRFVDPSTAYGTLESRLEALFARLASRP